MNILKIKINGISQWIRGKQNKLEAQVLKKAFLKLSGRQTQLFKGEPRLRSIDVDKAHEGGPGPGRHM